jgi:hypothetical protein
MAALLLRGLQDSPPRGRAMRRAHNRLQPGREKGVLSCLGLANPSLSPGHAMYLSRNAH